MYKVLGLVSKPKPRLGEHYTRPKPTRVQFEWGGEPGYKQTKKRGARGWSKSLAAPNKDVRIPNTVSGLLMRVLTLQFL